MKKKISLALAGAAALAMTFTALTSLPASALTCGTVSGNGGGGWVCTDYDPQGYQARYNTGPNAWGDYMDFNLVCNNGKTIGDLGAFRAHANATYTYIFKVGSQGTCHVVVYDRSSGGQWSANSVTR